MFLYANSIYSKQSAKLLKNMIRKADMPEKNSPTIRTASPFQIKTELTQGLAADSGTIGGQRVAVYA